MYIVVEGPSDGGAARAVVEHAGHPVTRVHVAGGKTKLDPKLAKYARAARREPWVVFRDTDTKCPVALRQQLLHGIPDNRLFTLRLVHCMTESWLMADTEGFAHYFKVSPDIIPRNVENPKKHAKHTLLTLCLRSKSRDIREEVAHDSTTAGELFVLHLNEFATHHWDVEAAAQNSPSLRRAVAALSSMPKGPNP
ncbi:hypothetical protein [Cutibacterium sp. V947]|uniref:hypothetical protein n=1 Tax=Cutibacterium sp. V947 TaxID=3446480 RepID=UPI003EE1A8C5